MASSMEEQSLDLTTCCICLESYDLKGRKPKYVPCTHTFCQVCLKVRIYYLLKKHILSFNRVFIILNRVLVVISKIVWLTLFLRPSSSWLWQQWKVCQTTSMQFTSSNLIMQRKLHGEYNINGLKIERVCIIILFVFLYQELVLDVWDLGQTDMPGSQPSDSQFIGRSWRMSNWTGWNVGSLRERRRNSRTSGWSSPGQVECYFVSNNREQKWPSEHPIGDRNLSRNSQTPIWNEGLSYHPKENRINEEGNEVRSAKCQEPHRPLRFSWN